MHMAHGFERSNEMTINIAGMHNELGRFMLAAANNNDTDPGTDPGFFAELHPDKEPPGEGGMSFNDVGRYALSAA